MRSIRIRQCALFGLSPDGHTAETAAAEPVSAKGGVISQTVDPRNIKLPQAGPLQEYDTCEKCKAPPGWNHGGARISDSSAGQPTPHPRGRRFAPPSPRSND